MSDEKHQDTIGPALSSTDSINIGKVDVENDGEVFKRGEGIEDFRTVSWIHTSVIFLKLIFATGVLTIPSAMYTLGAFPGAVNVLGWQFLNTWCALVQGNFARNHPGCHSIADMGNLVGGKVVKEITGVLFLLAFVIVAASGMVGVSTALNALSNHSLCTNYFSIIAAIMIALCASVRKFEKLSWITWAGFASVFIAVFVVVVGVTTLDRPAAAPQSGPYDFGYHVIGHPTFAAGITAASTIFCSGAGTSAFLPVRSEMRNPKEFSKAVNWCMGIVTAAYLSFSLVVYKWCGKWVASPSLGSAGPMVKKISYGIGIIGLCVSGALYVHVSAKYIFVRILRNSKHLQANSAVHWGTWLGCVASISVVSFLIASGVPIFNYLLSLAGSIAFAPLALGLPGWLWLYDHVNYWKGSLWQKTQYMLHIVLILISIFLTIGGTYGVIAQILDAYKSGSIDSAFSCADNSNSS
ncbi:transmembrane amino acid transporter protein-domain-containing protein [Paraphoma chrysanthemicola]|uniref:Transmembrane amino acid transporter protein-domain-containing protein n=1 Tax=Paraphoma chrysanthemicola TaxID=798071 RepID=A0A8K0RE28_9PLEO|nr:transmembrane amino acid transporter protein-domain-containing protein [Paraphoma chrysanthemicola]